MKNNGLKNPFPPEVREIYIYVYYCFQCNHSDRPIELHHIFGRESDSAFNACVLCHDCHEAVKHTEEERHLLFNKNLQFLIDTHYKPTEKDCDFIKRHPFLVKNVLQ